MTSGPNTRKLTVHRYFAVYLKRSIGSNSEELKKWNTVLFFLKGMLWQNVIALK
jgi:hypothetical protein